MSESPVLSRRDLPVAELASGPATGHRYSVAGIARRFGVSENGVEETVASIKRRFSDSAPEQQA